VVTQLTGLGELQLQPHMVCFFMRMQMWSSVRVVVQMISRTRSGERRRICHALAKKNRLSRAEFVTSFYQQTAVLVHGNFDPSRGLAARGLTVRRPW
jgi:hypothetical protein